MRIRLQNDNYSINYTFTILNRTHKPNSSRIGFILVQIPAMAIVIEIFPTESLAMGKHGAAGLTWLTISFFKGFVIARKIHYETKA
jgi:hypothetical protein